VRYVFDFSKMTTGDMSCMLYAAETANVSTCLAYVDKFTVGGAFGAHISELPNLLAQFGAALKEFIDEFMISFNKLPQTDEDNVTRLLHQALGGGDANDTRL
jgi:hypothetical protein